MASRPPARERVPKVSVCIPSHNAAPYLPAAIDSVLGQEFEDFEVIVCDDASGDHTPEVCEGYDDPRFRAERSKVRLGMAGNWNRCLDLARGDYVTLLHGDDELLPGYLGRTVTVLDHHPDVGLVHCAVRHIDEAGSLLTLQRAFEDDRVDRRELVLHELLVSGCLINPAGVTVPRRVYQAVGEFSTRVDWCVDWHMWVRIALRWPVAYLAEPLARYRRHPESATPAIMASGRNVSEERWAIDDLMDLIRRTRPDLCHLRQAAIRGGAHRAWCAAERSCEAGDMPAARAGLRNLVRLYPETRRQAKVWALWAASYTGYRSFAMAHTYKQRLMAG